MCRRCEDKLRRCPQPTSVNSMTGPPGLVARRLTTCRVMAGLRVEGRPWKVSRHAWSRRRVDLQRDWDHVYYMCTRHTSRPDACERPYGLRLTSHPIPRAGSASEQKRGRSVRAFGKDRAPETKAPARSITAAVPTPLGPPVGCHPTPSDGIAYALLSVRRLARERG